MKQYFVLLLLTLFIGSNISCKKYLDEKSDASLIVPTTLNDLQSLMDDPTYMNRNSPAYGMASCDDYFITQVTYNSRPERNKYVYRWIPFEYRYINDYAIAYKPVYNSNICLERVMQINRVISNALFWDQIKGSALFYRSYYYLELAWVYAKAYDLTTASTDLGIVLRNTSNFNDLSKRSSIKETYDRIVSDTKEAAMLLPDHVSNSSRPCKAAAYGLLARAYLSMRVYDSAGKYATKALEYGSSLMDYNNTGSVSVASTTPFKRFNGETVFYAGMTNSTNVAHPNFGAALIDTGLYKQYAANDIRKKAFFTASGNYQRFKGSYTGETTLQFSGIAIDELWLIKAESFARAGKVTEAMTALNYMLQNRFVTGTFIPLAATTADVALETILKERRKELINRGSLRWMDVKRLNKEGAAIVLKRIVNGEVFSLTPNESRYALPLPADVIELAGIPQN